jgi:hypothetical protein
VDRSGDREAQPRAADRPADAVGWLKSLQQRLVDFESPGDLNEIVVALGSALHDVLAEHRGMAEELIGAYEQLGIIFEVTRRLPEVQAEAEVLDLFAESLRQSFASREVLIARPRPPGGWTCDRAPAALGGWACRVIERACERGSAVVEAAPSRLFTEASEDGEEGRPSRDGDAAGPDGELMAAPVHAGGTLVCALVLVRSASSPAFRAVDMMLAESLATFCGDLIRNHRLVHELREMSIAMVRSLVNAVDQKDEYTCGHSLRVAYYATELGKRLALSEVELQMLQWSALLHDVGKIGIRDAVLKKEGKLTEEEFDHIKEHPVRSYRVVAEVGQLAGALDGILHHHERWNGTGYPDRLAGDAIPLQARIIQMADMFDALTSNRSYRPAFDWQKALQIMEEEGGSTVDPTLQRVFDRMIRSRLEGDGDAWAGMVREAEQFTRADAAPPWPRGGA